MAAEGELLALPDGPIHAALRLRVEPQRAVVIRDTVRELLTSS